MQNGLTRTICAQHQPPHGRRRAARASLFTRGVCLALCFALCLSILPARALSIGDAYPCGYAGGDGEEGHVCSVTQFSGYTPGTPIATASAVVGDTAAAIADTLPKSLPGSAACAPGRIVDVPVTWTCAEFDPFTAGAYRLTASFDAAVVSFDPPDDPSTPDIDERNTSPYCDPPYIEVTTAGGPAAESGPSEAVEPADAPDAPATPARGHVCEALSFPGFDPSGEPPVAQIVKGRPVEELYSEVLPQTLAVSYACACAESPAELPVGWTCEGFDPNRTGDYLFTAAPLHNYPFTYLPQDDPATPGVDEGALPSICVRVYEPAAPTETFTVRYGELCADGVHVRSGPGTTTSPSLNSTPARP